MIIEPKCNVGDKIYFLSMLGNRGTGEILPLTCARIIYDGDIDNLLYEVKEAYICLEDKTYDTYWFIDYNLAWDALKEFRNRGFFQ